MFVDEQQIPEELERDAIDAWAMHFVGLIHNENDDNIASCNDGTDSRSLPVATLRVFVDHEASDIPHGRLVFRMGRVAVLREMRGRGYGKLIVREAERVIAAMSWKELQGMVDAVQRTSSGCTGTREAVDSFVDSFVDSSNTHAALDVAKLLPQTSTSIRIDLHSQFDRNGFYEALGYVPERDPDTGEYVTFLEEGIVHSNMSKVLRRVTE